MPRPKSETVEGKPPYSYVSLCCMAIMSSPMKMVTLSQIYEFITEHFVYYRNTTNKWQNSLRHNLSYNQCFIKIPRGGGGKGNYWALHPRASAMFENGTAQRRKKRFKVEDDDSEGGIKGGPELLGPGYPYIVPNIDAYIDQNTVPANAPKIANDLVREHREWLQSRLSRQEKEEDSDSLPQSNEKHSTDSAKIFAFTIENLLKPDSPKRKKKVYRSTEVIEADSGADSSSSGIKKTRDKASCARKIGTSVGIGSSPLYTLDHQSPDLLTPPKEEQLLHYNLSYNHPGLPQMPSYLPHHISQYQRSSSAFTQADLNALASLPGYGYTPYAGMMSLPQSYPPMHMYPQATGAHHYPVGMYPSDNGFPGYGGHINQSLLLGS